MSGLVAVGYFLFALFFSLLSFVLWARIACAYFRISPFHPIAQSIYRLTNPIVMPLTHLVSHKKTGKSRYDWPCFSLLVVVEILKFIAIATLFLGLKLSWEVLPIYTIADLIVQPCNLLFYAILIRVIMSWVNPIGRHPVTDILYMITEPMFRFGHRFIPVMAGFDVTPMVIMVLLKVITLYISASLPLI